jgi:hypothetical protein
MLKRASFKFKRVRVSGNHENPYMLKEKIDRK